MSAAGLLVTGLSCGGDISSREDGGASASGSTSGSTTLLSDASGDEIVPIDCARAVELYGDLIVGEDQPPGPAVRHVRGRLRVVDTNARTDLDHLRCLTQVDGDVSISNNFRLTDVSGLEGLERVGGQLAFSGNEALPSIGPLPRLRELGGLHLGSNPELTHFELGAPTLAFENPSSDPERSMSLRVANNDELERFSLGVEQVRSNSEIDLRFDGNETLSSIDVEVFADVRVGVFEVIQSPALRQLRFGGAEVEVLRLDDTPLLASLGGFGELEVVTQLRITPAKELKDLRDLSSLRHVSALRIGQCRAGHGGGVESLDGLHGVRGLEYIVIASNPELEDISALSSAETTSRFPIFLVADNPRLAGPAIDEVIAALGVEPEAPSVCGSRGVEACGDPPVACGIAFW